MWTFHFIDNNIECYIIGAINLAWSGEYTAYESFQTSLKFMSKYQTHLS